MSLKDLQHMAVIKELIKGNLTVREAAWACELSIRQIYRLRKKANEHGIECIRHGNSGRKSKRGVPEELKQRIVELYCSTYFDCSFSYFSDLFLAEEKCEISRCTIYRILRAAGLSPAHKKRRRKRQRKTFGCSTYDDVKTSNLD